MLMLGSGRMGMVSTPGRYDDGDGSKSYCSSKVLVMVMVMAQSHFDDWDGYVLLQRQVVDCSLSVDAASIWIHRQ